MALANVAVILAQRLGQRRVIVRDFNYDGQLHRYFGGLKHDAPFLKHGVVYAERQNYSYAEALGADFELICYPPSHRARVEGTSPDILVPVLTPGVHSPRAIADCVYPTCPGQVVLPFLSRTKSDFTAGLNKMWREEVIAAFSHAGLSSEHYYQCEVPEFPLWSFFREEVPIAATKDHDPSPAYTHGYMHLADAIQSTA